MLSPMRVAVLVSLVAGAVAIVPADVSAGGFIREPTFAAPPVCSSLTLCGTDGDCTTGMSCANFGTQGSYCADMGQDLYCCDSGAACPVVDGIATTCVPVATDSGAISLCLPPDPRVCASAMGGMITWAQIEVCYRSALDPSTHVYDWEHGDCDGDGIANGMDTAPCVSATADAGTNHDASTVDVPSPADVVDDTPAAVDVVAPDVPLVDVVTSDSVANDATSHDADAASQQQVGEIPAVSFRGGGCRCDLARTNDRAVSWRFGLLFTAFVAIANRRRRIPR